MASTAGDVRAGGAWYELWGKDKLTPVLDKAKKAAESFGGVMAKIGKRAGKGAEEGLDGVRGSISEMAKGALVELAKGIVNAIGGLEHLQKEYERTALAITRASLMSEMNMARRGEMLEAEIDPAQKRLAIEKELAKLEQERLDAVSRRDSFQERKDRLGVFKLNATKQDRADAFAAQVSGLFGGASLEKSENDLNQHLDHANEDITKLFQRMQELSTQRGRLMRPDRDPERIREIAELTRELKKQADTFGQTAERVQIYEQMLKGATIWQLALIGVAQNRKKLNETLGGAAAELFSSTLTTAEDLKKEIEETTKALKEQADTWNMTAEQATLYKLKAKGATDAALEKARTEVGRIRLENFLGGAADAITNGIGTAEKLTLASPGSFSAGNAAQRFGADTIPLKQLKAADQTAKNTEATVRAVTELAKGLRFK
ncbi:unnamed protein product [Gemmata massiliana]|uniref:Uncharacterized protein n=1 Tax=Gemmata massiliana TaxID=1210884 RepID=A0A6P2D035_9BACT|nr:hypothetical protein [Gemmata massiliana]VTR92820.1 unnamed protein product [Gemmata massiliana]